MNVVITGHTSGIGKAVLERFYGLGFETVGVSRKNGWDLEHPNTIPGLLETYDCNVVVNNAYCGDVQRVLLREWFLKNRHHSNRCMVVIGSLSTNVPMPREEMINYVAFKEALHRTCYELQILKHQCRLILVRPGFVDTPFVAAFLDKKKHRWLSPSEVSKIIVDAVIQTDHMEMREIVCVGRDQVVL